MSLAPEVEKPIEVDFPKQYDHTQERARYQSWMKQGLFEPETVHALQTKLWPDSTRGEHFSIAIPPPNVTGVLHLGHALMAALEDGMTRHARMNGYKTVRIPGTDHAAIATQVVVQNKLKKEKNLTRYDLGRTDFLKEVRDRTVQSHSTITSQIQELGSSCDRSREQFTMSASLSRAVRKSFALLHRHKKIYRDDYVVNRSVGTQSVVSDIEVEYEEEKGKLYYIKYFVEGKRNVIVVATTRPETMFADVAVAVHPKDKRYKKYIGKNVIIPIINRAIPVIGDERIDPEFGTGAVKMTPTHDPLDFAIAKTHGLDTTRYAFDTNGMFTEEAGEIFAGKKASDFIENIVTMLEDITNLDHVEDYTHSVPYCERTHTRIQPMLSQQWFVDVNDAAAETLEWIDQKKIIVSPDRFVQTFHHWLDNIKPRCISRQLRRGHRIPVRHSVDELGVAKQRVWDEDAILAKHQSLGETSPIVLSLILFNLVADSQIHNPFDADEFIDTMLKADFPHKDRRLIDVYLNIYAQKFDTNAPLLAQVTELEGLFGKDETEMTTDHIERLIEILGESFLISQQKTNYIVNLSILADNQEVVQDEDVLDTRFSSALRPFSVLGRPEKTPDFNEFYPTTVLETGHDIIFFWVARMMMMAQECLQNQSRAETQKALPVDQTIPFKHIYFHGLVRDEKGQKMSKSKGNGIDPLKVIEEFGADPLRLALVIGNTPGTDLNFGVQKIDYYYRFVNKLRNATRFIVTKITPGTAVTRDAAALATHLEAHASELNHFDNRILNKINDLIEDADQNMKKYLMGELGNNLISFVRHYFCDRYIEIAKVEQTDQTPYVFAYAISVILRILHPFAPFITEELRETLGFQHSISINPWPTKISIPDRDYKINLLMDIITELRNLRNQAGCQHHEKANCYIKSSKNFIEFATHYEKLIKNLVSMENVTYLLDHQEPESDYFSSVIINISVGVKGIKTIDKPTQILNLTKQLEQEQQYLQSMRSILANPGFRAKAPADVIAEKEAKINAVKDTITQLEYEINKLKM